MEKLTKAQYKKLVKQNFTIGKTEDKKKQQKATINKDYKLSSDGIYGERIPLPMYKLHHHKLEIFPDGSVFASIVGRQGSGKTVQLLSLIPQLNYDSSISQIMICSLKVGDPAHDAVQKYCENTGIRYEFSNDVDDAMDKIEDMVNTKDPHTYGILIFDDFTNGDRYSSSNQYNKIISTFFCIARGSGFHAIMITQDNTNVIPLVKTNTNLRIIYPMARKIAVDNAAIDFEFLVSNHTKDEFYKYYKMLIEKKYSFMVIANNKVWLDFNDKRGLIRVI